VSVGVNDSARAEASVVRPLQNRPQAQERRFERLDAVWINHGKRYVYPGKGRLRLVGKPPKPSRTIVLTPKGNREAFLQALDRIQAK
jgi:hypothetical protein